MLHCVSLDDTDIYEEKVELGLLERMKPHPSSKVISDDSQKIPTLAVCVKSTLDRLL